MSSFEVITGFWKRRSASRTNAGSNREEYFYGKPKLENGQSITINPGDELYMFSTTATNAGRGAPQMFLKVKRASTQSGEEEATEVAIETNES
jgi:hypothetical protein